jgi:hypothetical protein
MLQSAEDWGSEEAEGKKRKKADGPTKPVGTPVRPTFIWRQFGRMGWPR